MSEKYTITSIVQEAPAQYGKTRIVFKTIETGDKMLSAFAKFPLKEGQIIEGNVTETQKGDKIYYNFNFGTGTKENTPQSPPTGIAEIKNFLEFKVMPAITEIRKYTDRKENEDIMPNF